MSPVASNPASLDSDAIAQSFAFWRAVTAEWSRSGDVIERCDIAARVLGAVPQCHQDLELGVVIRTLSGLSTRFLESTFAQTGRPVWGERRRKATTALLEIRSLHGQTGLSLSVISQRVGISRFTLSHMLKRETGHRLAEHIHTCRTLHAVMLLLQTPLSIKEVAAAVGYAQTSDFDRVFHRCAHITPGQFRGIAVCA